MLHRCLRLKDDGVAALANACRGIERLLLYACMPIGDTALQAIGGSLQHLREIDLCGAQGVTGAALISLFPSHACFLH